MTQSRKMSLVETCCNVAIGYVVAVGSQLAIFPRVGIHIPFHTNLEIGLYFTIVSIIRGYIVRRIFNKMRQK